VKKEEEEHWVIDDTLVSYTGNDSEERAEFASDVADNGQVVMRKNTGISIIQGSRNR
jgi:hypothetical protein